MFFNQFSDFLNTPTVPDKTLLMGDFNFHFENVENNSSRKIHDIIDMFNITQSVSESTHNQGHLLDLVFSKQSDNILISAKLHHGLTSDHTAILCKRVVSVPVQKSETFPYWCLKKIDSGAFKQDLSHAVSQVSSISDYYDHLCSVLDKHAPLCRCTVRTRNPTPWFSSTAEQFCELKREQIFTSCFKIWLWRPSEYLFWLQNWENPHHQKKKSSSKPNCLPWYLFRWKSIANFWACHWWICLKNNQQRICQVLWTTLLYENLDILLQTITNIINTSITTGIVPRDLKTAFVKPLLKKPSFDKNLL